MANFGRHRWARYAPPIDNNRELPEAEQFFLRIKAGLTFEELAAFDERVARKATGPDALTHLREAFAGLLEVGAPATIDGVEIATGDDYLRVVASEASQLLFIELIGAVHYFNSVRGASEDFSARLSGGTPFTAPTKAPERVAPGSGSGTSGSGSTAGR